MEIPLYYCEQLNDEAMIHMGLTLLDEQLSRYPAGFFTQLRIEQDKPFHFQLVGFIQHVFSGTVATGVCTEMDGIHLIGLSVREEFQTRDWGEPFLSTGDPFLEYALHHEIGHGVDYIIQRLTTGTPFDPEKWDQLLPPEFRYDDYIRGETDAPQDYVPNRAFVFRQGGEAEAFFCDIYAKSSLEEHIASLFGYAMCAHPAEALKSPWIQEQIQYYFPLIRNTFQREGWPETTYWERTLVR